MPNYTSKLNLPKPLGTENVTRAAHNELVDAIDAGAQKEIYKGTTAPATPVDNDLWLDTSVTPNVLKRYDLATTNWVKVTPTTASEISQDANNRFVTDTEKSAWNAKETPAGAQAKVDTGINNHTAAADPHPQYAKDTDLSSHTTRTDNPHGVTPAQIGAVATSSYTAADVLAKIKTVDGAGSGLDADLLDGKSSSYFSNSIATGSAADPNTTQEAYILTNHANSPGGGVYWHIRTFFYSSLTGNRAQIALRYNGTADEMYIRSMYNSVWTSWKRVWHAGNDGTGSGLDADTVDGFEGMKLALASVIRNLTYSAFNGSVTISTNTVLSDYINMYDNLTINSGIKLYVPENTISQSSGSGPRIIVVKGTLTLNGTISVSGAGPKSITRPSFSGGGEGGAAGSILVILANQITGNGIIEANGLNGHNGISGTDNSGGYIQNGSVLLTTVGGGESGDDNTVAALGGTVPSNAKNNFILSLSSLFKGLDENHFGGGAGGAGAGRVITSVGRGGVTGGAGGAGVVGNGGNSGELIYANPSENWTACAGGGGGGGALVIISPNNIPSITLRAKGGNGGNAIGAQASGSGGGGGGLILVSALGSSVTFDTTGGAVGTGGANQITPPQAGTGGLGLFIPM